MDNLAYREYEKGDAASVARMWEESRGGWPSGFLGASRVTAASVEREERGSGSLFTVLALHDERVIGYCRTSPYGGEPDATYVDLVNVVPEFQGHGIGKRLLLDAVRRTAESGRVRIDLHTWPSNMQAVPLYKKTGFFWVPETSVYMQNYIPFLLGREEFTDFLEGDDWYGCFKRELETCEDRQKTASGREVFRYLFQRAGGEFLAEFDKNGRRLSSIETPGFKAGIRTDGGGDCYSGTSYKLELTGEGFDPEKAVLKSDDSIQCRPSGPGLYTFTPAAARIERTPYEAAERIDLELPDRELTLSVGIRGREPVSLQSDSLLHLPLETEELELDLKVLKDVSQLEVVYSIDEGAERTEKLDLSEGIYQTVSIPLPRLEQGLHTLSLRTGANGYPEKIILVSGVYSGPPAAFDTRRKAVIAGRDFSVTVNRKGGAARLWTRGRGIRPVDLGWCYIVAGPPGLWNSDLRRQVYELTAENGTVSGTTGWPSRPGITHSIRVELNPAGYLECSGGVRNGSDANQKIFFQAANGWSRRILLPRLLLPVQDGVMVEKRVYNQVPDWNEDIGGTVKDLAAPWMGVASDSLYMVNYFPDWTEMERRMPCTGDKEVAPGEVLESPVFRMLPGRGDLAGLRRQALQLGWQMGSWSRIAGFYSHDLVPVTISGSSVSLSHPLDGERKGRILQDGRVIASGKVRKGKEISGVIKGTGKSLVSLDLSGRTHEIPVFLVAGEEKVQLDGSDADQLVIENSRVRAILGPGQCGHVHSLKLDGVEYLASSHPEPSEFVWEKPWFGGIIPYFRGEGNKKLHLENEEPSMEAYSRESGGLVEKGWRATWSIDHRLFGTLQLVWEAGLVPGVPLLRTRLTCRMAPRSRDTGEMEIRGYLDPAGSRDSTVLTYESDPVMKQGREHGGAWTDTGRWAKLIADNVFVQVSSGDTGTIFSEDFGKDGCHFSLATAPDRTKTLEMDWFFGKREDDDACAGIMRIHRTLRDPCLPGGLLQDIYR